MGGKKWLFGFFGCLINPIGGLLGFLIGTFFDLADDDKKIEDGGGQWRRATSGEYYRNEQRSSFMMSLLVLSTAVVKADGKVSDAELATIKNFIRTNFGSAAAEQSEQIVRTLMNKQINVYEVGAQIKIYMNYSQRLQLFQYLVQLGQCDGMSKPVVDVLESIAAAIGLYNTDRDSLLNMYRNASDSAYKVLGIESTAKDDEVRKAYKRMALKYHPDKVATLGEDVQKAAEEKFKKVQQAYEQIKKERGL